MDSTENKPDNNRFLLTSENYAIWTIPMEAKLEDLEALEIVTGVLQIKDKTSAEDVARITKLNRKAYSKIVQNLDSDNLALVSTTLPITDKFNGRALWTLLLNKYAGSDLVARSAALDLFLDLEYDNIASFVKSIRLANQKLVLAGILLDDQVKMMIMLKKLPRQDFRSFRDIVAMGFSTESFESIVKRLESYSITNHIKKESSAPLQSLLTRSSNMKTCVHCNKPGHQPANCWVKYPEKAPKTETSHLTTGDFSHFRTSDGKLHSIDDIRFENVQYH
ncbi:hypothetical protein MJO28_000223 [Puccinia striiformis f. sp. tritici]|uniref:Uncharacterized protein n=1 Tax=Puccinia striiformis f. sp. tritici TaxID=168172 RepID=A0ACC0EWM9_9BASI|nr:hypothetical protein MJO28_000223 [Puccinia striiformis f. sp. tritici]